MSIAVIGSSLIFNDLVEASFNWNTSVFTIKKSSNPDAVTTPYWLSNYYRGGAHVRNTLSNQNVPVGGTIFLSNFFGQGN